MIGHPPKSPPFPYPTLFRSGAPDPLLPPRINPWEIWTADATTGVAQRLWKSPETLPGSVPTTDGGTNLGWGAGDRIAFLSYQDGWPHLYSIPASGGTRSEERRVGKECRSRW